MTWETIKTLLAWISEGEVSFYILLFFHLALWNNSKKVLQLHHVFQLSSNDLIKAQVLQYYQCDN